MADCWNSNERRITIAKKKQLLSVKSAAIIRPSIWDVVLIARLGLPFVEEVEVAVVKMLAFH